VGEEQVVGQICFIQAMKAREVVATDDGNMIKDKSPHSRLGTNAVLANLARASLHSDRGIDALNGIAHRGLRRLNIEDTSRSKTAATEVIAPSPSLLNQELIRTRSAFVRLRAPFGRRGFGGGRVPATPEKMLSEPPSTGSSFWPLYRR